MCGAVEFCDRKGWTAVKKIHFEPSILLGDNVINFFWMTLLLANYITSLMPGDHKSLISREKMREGAIRV